MAPPSNSSEEVALCESAQVVRVDLDDAPFVDLALGDVPMFDEFSKPGSSAGIVFVVVSMSHFPVRLFGFCSGFKWVSFRAIQKIKVIYFSNLGVVPKPRAKRK